MWVDELGFRELVTLNESAYQRWLADNRPDVGDGCGSWLENIAERALQEVYGSDVGLDRIRYARLAIAATDEAVRVKVMNGEDRLIRVANLAYYWHKTFGDVSDIARPEELARQCLLLIGMGRQAIDGKVLDLGVISKSDARNLRRIKNLLTAIEPLVDRVYDTRLRGELESWLEVRNRLP